MNISVVIPTLNRENDLKNLINSLEMQILLPQEVIVVDQSDVNLTKGFIINYNKINNKFNIRYLKINEKSLTIARNAGIRNISKESDLIVFFDDDVILEKEYLNEISNFFMNDTKEIYAAATGYIKNNNWKSKISFLFSFFFLQEFKDGKFKANGLPTFPRYTNVPYEIEVLSGCNMVFRKKIISEYEFDEKMKYYCYMEDVDISYRVSRKYKISYIPRAQLIHKVSKANRMKIKESASFFLQNYYYLFKKNIQKNPITVFTFIWSVIGLFFISIFLLKFKSIIGYMDGIIRIISNKYSSLRNDN